MILKSNSFLGFNIYKRTRLYEKQLTLTPSKIHCDDVGLYIIGQYPNLEYNFVTVFPKKEWDFIAADTINLVLINLILSGTIEIYEYLDEKAYFLKLIKSNTKNYYLKIINSSFDEDLLTRVILSIINELDQDKTSVKDLKAFSVKLLDYYLGVNSEDNRPEKKFVIEILKRYSKKYEWLKIVSTKKLLGIYKDYNIELNRIYIPRITMQHENLIDYHSNELRRNRDYLLFMKIFRETLSDEFRRRLPKNDD